MAEVEVQVDVALPAEQLEREREPRRSPKEEGPLGRSLGTRTRRGTSRHAGTELVWSNNARVRESARQRGRAEA